VRYLNSGIFQHEVLEYVKGNNDVQKDVLKELSEKQKVIIEMIIADPFLSAKAISEKMSEKMSEKEGVNERTIERDLAKLKKLGILTCESGRKEDRRGIKV
jgi:ATP-dependent DNA helicase RecG